jgi:hypothetical protein
MSMEQALGASHARVAHEVSGIGLVHAADGDRTLRPGSHFRRAGVAPRGLNRTRSTCSLMLDHFSDNADDYIAGFPRIRTAAFTSPT